MDDNEPLTIVLRQELGPHIGFLSAVLDVSEIKKMPKKVLMDVYISTLFVKELVDSSSNTLVENGGTSLSSVLKEWTESGPSNIKETAAFLKSFMPEQTKELEKIKAIAEGDAKESIWIQFATDAGPKRQIVDLVPRFSKERQSKIVTCVLVETTNAISELAPRSSEYRDDVQQKLRQIIINENKQTIFNEEYISWASNKIKELGSVGQQNEEPQNTKDDREAQDE
jgi:hypothetical protein